MQPLVSFLIAGAQKGGTTALHDYLAAWPDVALADVKEVHFFDDESQDWARPDYGAYHDRFPRPDGRPMGEATPIYLYWPNCLERIATYNPAMKLVVTLRDPVQRAWSHWRMEYARGVETQPFAWCIREGRARLAAARPAGFHREFSYVERGFYGAQLARLLELFPAGQLLVLRAEDLRREPQAPLAALRRVLGLAARPAPPRLESHVGRDDVDYGSQLTAADVAYLRDIYREDQARLAALARAHRHSFVQPIGEEAP